MTRANRALAALVLALGPGASAQPPRPIEPVPPEVVLETIRAAYTKRPIADEVVVHVKGARGVERTESLVVRIDPGATPGSAPERVLIELGVLKVCITGRDLVAVSTQSPDRYFQARLDGPPTAKTLASVLPPIPVPQLALAGADAELRSDLTPYTTGVAWSAAAIDSAARPAMAGLSGSSRAGPVSLTVVAASGRLSKLSATIGGRDGETALDLTIRPVDAGDPASWLPGIEGRRRVGTLAELRAPPPAPGSTGGRKPDKPDQNIASPPAPPAPAPANEKPPG